MKPAFAVLVVDDDPIACSSHVAYVNRVPGFRAVASATTAAAAIRRLNAGDPPIDLVLLDMNLPDRHGMEVIRALRSSRHSADIIAVTGARELATVRAAISSGVVQYLLKPFAFASLRDRLERYAAYRQSMARTELAGGQGEVDQLLGTLRTPAHPPPNGLIEQTLSTAVELLRSHAELSAPETADLMGTSRVTARRYLEHVVEMGTATREYRYGGAGRPVVVYRWQAP